MTSSKAARLFFLFFSLVIAGRAQWRVQRFGTENGLRGFHFNQVLIDRESRLWTSSSGGGIQRFDGERFRSILPAGPRGVFQHLLQRRDGSFVVTAAEYELRALRLVENRWTDSLLARLPVSPGEIRNMYEDAAGRILIAAINGAFVYAPGDTVVRPLRRPLYMTSFFASAGSLYVGASDGVFCFRNDSLIPAVTTRGSWIGCADHEGNFWFSSADSLLVMMTKDHVIRKRINLHAQSGKAMITTAPVYDGKNAILVGTSLGVLHYDLSTGRCSWPEWRDEHYRIVPHCAIYSLVMAAPGLAWCGTWSGLLRIQLETPGFIALPLIKGENETPHRLRCAASVNADTLLGGSADGSVYRFTRNSGSWKAGQLFVQPSIRINAVNALRSDGKNGLWIGRNTTLLHLDLATGATRAYPPTLVWSMLEDAKGCLWFSTGMGLLWRMRPGSDSCEALPAGPQEAPWAIYSMYAEGNVLLLATDHGIHYFDTQALTTDSGHAEYASLLRITDRCWSVCRSQGYYYIGAQNDGLLRVDEKTGKAGRLTSDDVFVFSAVCDSAGQCWAVTDKGLLRANGSGLRFYDERDGLLSSDLSFVGIRLLAGNEIMVAGEDGLSIVHAGEIPFAQHSVSLLIDHVEANGRLLAEDLRSGSGFTIAYGEKQISIHLCMPDAQFPERYRFRFRMDNDSAWSAWSKTPVLSFASFSPGEYRLFVEAQNSDGYSSGPTLLHIRVQPPFWQTGFFYTGASALSLLLIAAGVRLRIRALRRHYEMEQALLGSQHQALRMQMNPHFIFNSLNSIQEFIIDHKSREANLYLGKFSLMMRQIISYSRSDRIALQEEIRFLRLYLELEQLRFGFSFEVSAGGSVDPGGLQIPPMLIQPLVENAVKHGLAGLGRPGAIRVTFAPVAHGLLCTVEDNGRGREKAGQNRRADAAHESIGIANIRQRLTLICRDKAVPPFVVITDLSDASGNPSGTRVEMLIPFL